MLVFKASANLVVPSRRSLHKIGDVPAGRNRSRKELAVGERVLRRDAGELVGVSRRARTAIGGGPT